MPRKFNCGYDAEGRLKPKKADLFEKGEVDLTLPRKRDEGKIPYEISPGLIILVTPDKANKEYAEEYREKLAKSAANY